MPQPSAALARAQLLSEAPELQAGSDEAGDTGTALARVASRDVGAPVAQSCP